MPLSHSQISLYRTCPKQYEFACVKKLPRSISAGESFGSSVHNAFAKWGKIEIESGQKSEVRSQLQIFNETNQENPLLLTSDLLLFLWHQSFITEGYNSKEDADKARAKGEKVMEQFYEWWRREEREVVAVERGFTFESGISNQLSGIRGRFDRVEKIEDGVRVVDFKTGALRDQESVNSDLQLSLYALAAEQEFNVPCTELVLLFLDEHVFTERKTTRSKQQLEEAISIINQVHEGIEEQDFHATPSKEICGRCPYRNVCSNAEM